MQRQVSDHRENMGEQHVRLEASLAPEVAATLIDLAQLAQRASSATFDTTGSIAHEVLARLLVLCAAQRGALLLGMDEHVAPEQPSAPSSLHPPPFRVLALHGIGEEEAHALLTAFPSTVAHAQPGPDMTCWITSRLPLGAFLAEIEQSSQDVLSPPESDALPTAGSSPTLVRQPVHALSLIGWTTEKHSECAWCVARGHQLLPFVLASVISRIVTLL